MRLGLHVLPNTIDEYLENLGRIAQDPNTLVFLDTNILGYLYKLHSAARKEFFNWTAELELVDGRLYIPGWSANEYLVKFKNGKFSEYAPSRPEQVSKSLRNLWETASLFVDDDVLRKIGYADTRDNFLSGFDDAIAELEKFTKVFLQQFETWEVHNEITSNLSRCVLKSDLAGLCARAASEGDARISHRLPPGFRDSNKAENKYGDLIIWYEILEHAKQVVAQRLAKNDTSLWHILFVTNDEKPDWVYAPSKRVAEIKGARREVRNVDPALKLPDPTLVSEFYSAVGHDNFSIATLPMLIRALSFFRAKDLEHLASAIQIEGEERTGSVEGKADEISTTSVELTGTLLEGALGVQVRAEGTLDSVEQPGLNGIPIEVAAPAIDYPPDAVRDGAYEADAPGVINEIIRALRSSNWYTQNPAIQRIKEIRSENFPPAQWFVLGRNIYQAACGNAQKALEFIRNLDIELSRFPDETAVHLLSGMVFEIYFDRDGKFRRRPKSAHIEQLMREVANPRYQRSRDILLGHLAPFDQWLPFKVGASEPISLVVEVVESAGDDSADSKPVVSIQSVQFLEKELLNDIDAENQNSHWGGIFSSTSTTTIRQIEAELSDNFVIPEWAIATQLNLPVHLGSKLRIPEGKVLTLSRPTIPDYG